MRSVLAACVVLAALPAADDRRFTPSGATSHHNLRYLGDDRYTGDPGPRRDQELVLDLHIPEQGSGPFPVIITVHGGAWSAGQKEAKHHNTMIQAAIDRGWAAVGLNYMLKPKEIVPHVFWDTQDAVRFLRVQAAKHRLDPTRIGAIGWSAGGWLVSNIALVGGDTVLIGHQGGAAFLTDFAKGGRRGAKPWIAVEGLSTSGFVFPAWSPTPAWPDVSGQIQAVAYDFAFWHHVAHPAAAAVCQWVGKGHQHKRQEYVDAVGIFSDYAELVADGAAGKQTHLPDLSEQATSLIGGPPVPLSERTMQFFDRAFGPEGRAPAPEVRPHLRVIDGPTEVRILVPDPTMVVHVTTDGSTPTTSSPVYTAPFTIPGPAVVKALATIPKRAPSGVVTATFLAGPVPPTITSPAGPRLPPAAVGTPYEVQFTATDGKVRWSLGGEILPRVLDPRDRTAKPVDVMGLHLDPVTGVLSGTPKIGGVFWVQINAARGPGQLAHVRNYLLPVSGTPGSLGGAEAGDDTNVEIARLPGWTEPQVAGLTKALAAFAPVTQDGGDETMLLVPAEHRAAAATTLAIYAAGKKLTFTPAP
jgi:hypothetical protein